MKPGSVRWFALLVAITATSLAAFWLLLGQRYSPENYEAAPMVRDTVEFAWIGGSLVAAVCGLVLWLRRHDAWRRLACGALPVALVSLAILAKTLLGAQVRMYDMFLFCVACGWTARLWTPTHSSSDARTTRMLRTAVWTAVTALAAWQFWQQVRYLNDLALGYADCGENARLMFNSVTNPRELFLRVSPHKVFLYDHMEIGIVPFFPLWFLWPDFKLTILLQVIAVFGVTVPLYFIGKRAFRDEPSALLLAFSWVLYPITSQFVYSASYGFRWGNLCLLFYFVALALWIYERPGWALVIAIWAILIKEEAAIIVGMFGLYLAIFDRRKIIGIALTVGAFGYFLLMTSVVLPAISGAGYIGTRFFYDLGHTKWEILLSPLNKPAIFWGHLFEPATLYFAAALLAPLLLLPLRRPAILFTGALTFVFCCLNPIFKNMCFHYQAALLPVVFWALVCAIQRPEDVTRRLSILTGVIVSCVVTSVFLGAQPWSKPTLTIHRSPGRLDLIQRFRAQIDPHGSLFTTQRVGAHFVTQRYLYLDRPVPRGIDHALLDMRDSWRGALDNLYWLQGLRSIQREVEANPQLHLVAAEDGLLLYSRGGVRLDTRKLVEHDSLPDAARTANLKLGSGVSLVGFTVSPLPRAPGESLDRVRVTTYSTVTMPTNADLAVRCDVHAGGDPQHPDNYASEFQPLGQCIWPIARWETNNLYADDFIITMPSGVAAEISSVSFEVLPLDSRSVE
ncbi:MAG TPA: DUF2079 domain-containing protein [Verrucomicrobiae bacterium]|nr:DUF2079 domain-containing protein [Verrucomicrobiae bacterium]